jgi:hypothetical protein
MDMGHSSGPLVLGIVIQASSMATGFLAGSGVCVLAALVFAFSVLPRKAGPADGARTSGV